VVVRMIVVMMIGMGGYAHGTVPFYQ
jgi:hypothetical protein